MRTRILLVVSAAVLAAGVMAGAVLATQPQGLTSTTIATGTLQPVSFLVKNGDWITQLRTKGNSSLTVVENRVAPGGTFGWHSHPGPSLIILKTGTLTFYEADDPTCTPEVHVAGDAFVDEGTDVHVARNESATQEAVVIVTRLLPLGEPSRVDQPDPGNCPF